jgi:hypothetical protein
MAFQPLLNESLQGVSNNLPTYEGNLNPDTVDQNLGLVGGLLLASIGSVSLVPPQLTDLATKLIELGAAALYDQQTHPELQGKDSLGATLWAQYQSLLGHLELGITALGGEPNIANRPNFVFAAPQRYDYQQF